jgi:hypothetical protein
MEEIRFYGDPMYSPEEHINSSSHIIPFIYFHGKLANILGIDIVFSNIQEEDVPLGIYDCLVGDKMNCKAFIYKTDVSLRGFIVLHNDVQGLKDAQEIYERKARFI